MATGKHVALAKEKDHKDQKGCVNKHEVTFDSPTYPNCAYKPNGYNAALGEVVKGTATSKHSLYEYDFTKTHPEGTPLELNHRARLPNQMAVFSSTGRQPKAEKELGLPRKEHKNTDPRLTTNAWHFVGSNYKVGHLPFGHEYHHIMPEEAISEALTEKEAEVLQAAEYNINTGKNLIILPITQDVAFALMLPKHKGWHRAYNQSCINVLNSCKQSLSESEDGHEITAANVAGVRTQIETWEDNTFRSIVAAGKTTAMTKKAAAKINDLFRK
ncbi:AHH domain-containing protein [Corallococcus sp. M34]|uniref:AHH domain-containing protein n=1 Tax=Citreicoccus inhibens TaxID=2849499 RepID=UPI001C2111FC|nr:AHH domain-containing protein [Citreicoccus inhibens]MBU8895371.1 AHH domain-containing protein [Citreicoccus inhibens]